MPVRRPHILPACGVREHPDSVPIRTQQSKLSHGTNLFFSFYFFFFVYIVLVFLLLFFFATEPVSKEPLCPIGLHLENFLKKVEKTQTSRQRKKVDNAGKRSCADCQGRRCDARVVNPLSASGRFRRRGALVAVSSRFIGLCVCRKVEARQK